MWTVASFYSNFIYETIYQISPESPEFYRRYYKNILVSFFGHSVDAQTTNRPNRSGRATVMEKLVNIDADADRSYTTGLQFRLE